MATRQYYKPLCRFVGCEAVDSPQFVWSPGFAVSQKQKNVVALHEAIKRAEPSLKVL